MNVGQPRRSCELLLCPLPLLRQDYAQFHGGRAVELHVGGGGDVNEKLFGR
jgi:hypothetical protein